MDLGIYELGNGNFWQVIDQRVKTSTDVFVTSIRPSLYRHGSPAGSCLISVLDENENVVSQSAPLLMTDIDQEVATGDPEAHGYVQFEMDVNFVANRVYTIRLSSTGGYTFSEDDYIGWATDWEHKKYARDYSPAGMLDAPLDVEFWGPERLRGY